MMNGADLVARRLGHFAHLSDDDIAMLSNAAERGTRFARARADLIREGQTNGVVRMILSGWACQYKVLRDGRRQIIGFLLPGDLCGLDEHLLQRLDHAICAITPLHFADVAPEAIEAMMADSGELRRALRLDALVAAATGRERIVSLGQRSAIERVGHLLCELFVRLGAVGLVRGNQCEVPLTQSDLADATGLTPVHVNRTLRELRERDLIALKARILVVPDFDQSCASLDYDPRYLLSAPARGDGA